ncbi:MAG TPA: hypothetical protein VGG15_10630 [Terriglobales bacterium]|jgi:hypothetical protein
MVLFASSCPAQVFTVTPEGIEGKYLDFHPTDIPLPQAPLTNHGREDLLRFMQAEQGFAMRPLPISVLNVHANGALQPSGSDYANAIRSHGLSVKAGERVTVTDVRIEKDRVILDFNGGPVHKHKWLRHISVGMDPNMTSPVVQDDPQAPSGSRIVLLFSHGVPDVTGLQVEALIKPIVDFSVKTPSQAYTDTLPPALRKTILEHHVLVGMNSEMVISALGAPKNKVRESDGNKPFEEWIYGDPPQPVQFVRFNGNRVIRVEIAKVGESPVIRTANEMGDYWNSAPADNTRIVKLGDQNPADSSAQNAPHAPPTLRNPGEKLPSDDDKTKAAMKPVAFPTDQSGQQTSSGAQKPANSGSSSSTTAASGSSSPNSPAASPAPAPPAPIHPTMPSPDEQIFAPAS